MNVHNLAFIQHSLPFSGFRQTLIFDHGLFPRFGSNLQKAGAKTLHHQTDSFFSKEHNEINWHHQKIILLFHDVLVSQHIPNRHLITPHRGDKLRNGPKIILILTGFNFNGKDMKMIEVINLEIDFSDLLAVKIEQIVAVALSSMVQTVSYTKSRFTPES